VAPVTDVEVSARVGSVGRAQVSPEHFGEAHSHHVKSAGGAADGAHDVATTVERSDAPHRHGLLPRPERRVPDSTVADPSGEREVVQATTE
jgi:hypothetical protein